MDALEMHVAKTEAEIAQMKDDIKAKKAEVKTWKKALSAFTPRKGNTMKNTLQLRRRTPSAVPLAASPT